MCVGLIFKDCWKVWHNQYLNIDTWFGFCCVVLLEIAVTSSYREFIDKRSIVTCTFMCTYIIHVYSEANTLLCTLLKAVNFGGKGGMLHFYYKEILLFVIGIWNGGLKEKE